MSDLYDISKLWQDWETVRLIGEGSFGKVYEIARNRFGIEERCALKVISVPTSSAEIQSLKNDGMDDQSVTAYYRGLVEEVVQEIALMKKLRDNNNIVRYEDYYVVEHEGSFGWDIVIRMELLKAAPLYFRENSLTVADVIKLGIDMCKALEDCETHKIIHRDIKPDNIFVSENGTYKLGDFGVARTIDKTMAGLSKKGTYTFMAPEVYKGEEYGTDVDIYSLGIVMYKLLNNNREPFLPAFPQIIQYSDKSDALVYRMNGRDIPPIAGLDDRLNSVILKACAFKSEDRYHSAAQLKAELQTILETLKENEELNTPEDTTETKSEKTVSVFGKNKIEASDDDRIDEIPEETSEDVFEIAKECATPYDFDTSVRLSREEEQEGTIGVFDKVPVVDREEEPDVINTPSEIDDPFAPQTSFMNNDYTDASDELEFSSQDDFTVGEHSTDGNSFGQQNADPEYAESQQPSFASDFGQTSFEPEPSKEVSATPYTPPQDFSSGPYTPSTDFDPFGGGNSGPKSTPKYEAKPYSGPTAEDFSPKSYPSKKSKPKWWIFAIIGAAVLTVAVVVVVVFVWPIFANQNEDVAYVSNIDAVIDYMDEETDAEYEDPYVTEYVEPETEEVVDYSDILNDLEGIWVYEDEYEKTTLRLYDAQHTDDNSMFINNNDESNFVVSYTRTTEMKSESAFSSGSREDEGVYYFSVVNMDFLVPEEDGKEGFDVDLSNMILSEGIYYNIADVYDHNSDPTGRTFTKQ